MYICYTVFFIWYNNTVLCRTDTLAQYRICQDQCPSSISIFVMFCICNNSQYSGQRRYSADWNWCCSGFLSCEKSVSIHYACQSLGAWFPGPVLWEGLLECPFVYCLCFILYCIRCTGWFLMILIKHNLKTFSSWPYLVSSYF